VSAFTQVVWDTSHVLSEHSLFGKALHSLMGYADRPTSLQLIVYAATLVIIFALMRWLGQDRQRPG